MRILKETIVLKRLENTKTPYQVKKLKNRLYPAVGSLLRVADVEKLLKDMRSSTARSPLDIEII